MKRSGPPKRSKPLARSTPAPVSSDENTVMLEIMAAGSPAALRVVVERAADKLMESLLAAPDITDPSIMLSVHPNDLDEPEMVEIKAAIPASSEPTGGDD